MNENNEDIDVIELIDKLLGRFFSYFILIFIDFFIAFIAGYLIKYFFSSVIISTFALFGIAIMDNQIPILCGCIGLLGSILRGY